MALYAQAEEKLIADQAIIPLYFYVTVYLKDPRVAGWYPNLLGLHPPKYLKFNSQN
jgi:ABC-type oligopeptide transport system substrate-binding subunit